MPAFSYVAQDANHNIHEGVIEGPGLQQVEKALRQKGFLPISIEEAPGQRGAGKPSLGILEALLGGGVSSQELIELSRDLAMLVKGGLPLLRALHSLSRRAGSPALKRALNQVVVDVSNGNGFSKALARHPRVFPTTLCALTQAGESSGKLVTTLQQFSNYLNRQEELQKKIQAALTYPAIVMGFAAVLLVYLSVKVIPTFAQIFKSVHLKLPALTQGVLWFSGFMVSHWSVLLAGVTGAILLLKLYLLTEDGRLRLVQLKLNAPLFRPLFENSMQEQFFATFTLLLSSGVSMVHALNNIKEVFADNPVYLKAIRAITADITGGKSFSASLGRAGIFSETTLDSLAAGEESGNLTEAMQNLADHFSSKLDHFTRQLATIIEPVMLIVVGVIVGVIMFSLFMPMMELSNLRPN